MWKIWTKEGFKKLPKVQNIAQSGHTDYLCYVKIALIARYLGWTRF